MKEYKKTNKNNALCHLLVKIGKKEHMENLIKKGEVYMNTTRFFKEHTNPEIGDLFEGVLYIKDGKPYKYRENIDNEKLFCMWHINDTEPIYEELIHSAYYDDKLGETRIALDLRKLSGFTDGEDAYMVVVYNVQEFNIRFKKACKELNVEFVDNRIVSYYDEQKISPDMKLSTFKKRKDYKKQQEIRYLVMKDDENPLILVLGSLNDIAYIYKVNEMCLNVIGTTK